MATILIVDDDAALRESLAETLFDLGHRAVQAVNGRVALDIAAREQIDAVLLDIRMPGADGLEILRRLRADRIMSPPVAILTAYATSANTIEAMRLGAFDHLVKPIGRDDRPFKSVSSMSFASRATRFVSNQPQPPHVRHGRHLVVLIDGTWVSAIDKLAGVEQQSNIYWLIDLSSPGSKVPSRSRGILMGGSWQGQSPQWL